LVAHSMIMKTQKIVPPMPIRAKRVAKSIRLE
jgi:hypothetical protein